MARNKETGNPEKRGRAKPGREDRGERDEGQGMSAPGQTDAERSASPATATETRRTPGGSDGRARGTRRGAQRGSTARAANGPDLRRALRDFAAARPQGWGHDDWLNFLESLKEQGHNINDREAIGVALEKERLGLKLAEVKGVGPQRRQALIEHYGTVWNVRNADPEEIASAAGMPRNLAEEVRSRMA